MEITLTIHSRWPRGMCREHTSMMKLAGRFTRIYLKDMSKLASWPDFAKACTERVTQRQFGETWSDVLKESSMKVGSACPAFLCGCDGDLKGLCHGDAFCVVARQKQLQIFGKVLEKRFEVKQTVYIAFSASDTKELKILNRTIKIDVLNDEMTLEADTKFVRECFGNHEVEWCKRRRFAVSGELKSKRRKSRVLRNSHQQSRLRIAAL